MAHQNRFQVFTQNSRLVYISRESLDEFRTKKLLGMKVISVDAHPTHLVDHILDMREEGVAEVASIQNGDGSRSLRFKLS